MRRATARRGPTAWKPDQPNTTLRREKRRGARSVSVDVGHVRHGSKTVRRAEGPVGVPSATGKRREMTGLHENENALFTEQVGLSPQVRRPPQEPLPRWGSRVRTRRPLQKGVADQRKLSGGISGPRCRPRYSHESPTRLCQASPPSRREGRSTWTRHNTQHNNTQQQHTTHTQHTNRR